MMESHRKRYETCCLALWRSFESLVSTDEEWCLVQRMVRLWASVILLMDVSDSYVGLVCRSIRNTCEKNKMLTLSHLNNFLNKGMDNKQEKNYVLCDDATDSPTILALLQHLAVSFYLDEQCNPFRSTTMDLSFAKHILFTQKYYTKSDLGNKTLHVWTIKVDEEGSVFYGRPTKTTRPLRDCLQWYDAANTFDAWTDCSEKNKKLSQTDYATRDFKVRVHPRICTTDGDHWTTCCSPKGVLVHDDSPIEDTFQPAFTDAADDDAVTLKCDGCNEERRLGCIDQLAGALGMDRSYVRECMETFKFTCYDAALTCSTDQPKVLNTLHPYGIFSLPPTARRL